MGRLWWRLVANVSLVLTVEVEALEGTCVVVLVVFRSCLLATDAKRLLSAGVSFLLGFSAEMLLCSCRDCSTKFSLT